MNNDKESSHSNTPLGQAPTPEDRLYRIVTEGACIGCGLCEAVAGPERVRVLTVENGYERPVVVGEIDHELVDRIYDVCPATRWNGNTEVDADTEVDLVWGPVRRTVLAHAGDPGVRMQAATGGILTALAMYLIDTGRVDSVLHATASSLRPTHGVGTISTDSTAVQAGSGSIYSPTAPLRLAEEALAQGRPFAVVAKPCDIAAFKNLALYDARVDRLVRYWLAPVCGGWTAPDAMAAFLARRGLTWRDLARFRHRGDGCPGMCEFETHDGRRFTAPMNEPFTIPPEDRSDPSTEGKWKLPYRCALCPDGASESADIAAGDIREDGAQKWDESHLNPGTNVVLVRTQRGEALLDAAVADGYVVTEDDMAIREFDDHQDHLVLKKQTMRARFDALAAEGRLVPRSQGLRLDENRRRMGQETYEQELNATRRRIRDGRGIEPDPIPSED